MKSTTLNLLALFLLGISVVSETSVRAAQQMKGGEKLMKQTSRDASHSTGVPVQEPSRQANSVRTNLPNSRVILLQCHASEDAAALLPALLLSCDGVIAVERISSPKAGESWFQVNWIGAETARFSQLIREEAVRAVEKGIMGRELIPPENCTVFNQLRVKSVLTNIDEVLFFEAPTAQVNPKTNAQSAASNADASQTPHTIATRIATSAHSIASTATESQPDDKPIGTGSMMAILFVIITAVCVSGYLAIKLVWKQYRKHASLPPPLPDAT